MTLKFIPLTQIKLNPNNPRKIDKGRKDVIMKSLINLPKMMTVRPIVIDKNYTVVGGNARLIALKEIKKMLATLNRKLFKDYSTAYKTWLKKYGNQKSA